MSQTILLFNINKDRHSALQAVCRSLEIRIIDVMRKDYAQQLGALAQIKGFQRKPRNYNGPEFPAEMLVFSEMNSDEIDTFLEEYRKTGRAPVGLNAVITSHNVFWSPEELFKELLKEHLTMGQK